MMVETTISGLSDRGSIPLTSILQSSKYSDNECFGDFGILNKNTAYGKKV
jgi:hypothetical protein